MSWNLRVCGTNGRMLPPTEKTINLTYIMLNVASLMRIPHTLARLNSNNFAKAETPQRKLRYPHAFIQLDLNTCSK